MTDATFRGLTHSCDDPDCHVSGFVNTLLHQLGGDPEPPSEMELHTARKFVVARTLKEAREFAKSVDGDVVLVTTPDHLRGHVIHDGFDYVFWASDPADWRPGVGEALDLAREAGRP